MPAAQIGLFGLGTMGSALALNMADNGVIVAVTNRDKTRVGAFMTEAGDLAKNLHPHQSLEAMVADLATPRIVLLMVPAGTATDQMIAAVAPLLTKGDTIIDAGNADFNDTRRRSATLAKDDLHFVGMGVSGGEEGARHGPSIMVGGTEHSWTQLRPILRAIAAKYEGDPCVDRLGPDGAGHFVKTVHNGIEYADMQLIAEVYGLLRYGLGRAPQDIGKLFAVWDKGSLKSYLVEITGKALQVMDPASGNPMVDMIVDSAGQKGTGRWTVIEAVKLGQSATMIEAAVAGRAWSAEKETRKLAEQTLGGDRDRLKLDDATLARAFGAARILDYAQGFRILAAASGEYDWTLDFARIAEIWRAGCIIRSAMLSDIADAFRGDLPGGQLILAPAFAKQLKADIPALRSVVAAAISGGHAVPALAAALGWYDSMRQGQGTANLIQAQRDFFGRHGFARLDAPGVHHAEWS